MKPLFDHFGKLAPIYEIVIHSGDAGRLWSLANLPGNAVVLDAGGGTGRMVQSLPGLVAQIVIADESYNMLREAQKKAGLQPACTHTESLPFRGGVFDCIIMVDALHHVAHQQTTVDELWRLLKQGGKIIIQEPDIQNWWVKLLALFEKLALMRSHFLSPQKIIDLFNGKNARTKLVLDRAQAIIIVEK